MSPPLDGTALYAAVLVAASSIVAVSASGAWWLRTEAARAAARLLALIGLAVGALAGDALLHLLPHAAAERGWPATLLLAAAGFGLFAAVDRLRGAARRPVDASGRWSRFRIVSVLVVDALHHLLDGAVLALAFMASPALGVATWMALLAHELPKEWGELAMLVAAGRRLGQAVRLNLAAAAPLLLGALLGLIAGPGAHEALGWLGAGVAGGFLYLALFLLLPAAWRLRAGEPTRRLPWASMAAGVVAMGLLAAAERRLGLDHGHVHAVPALHPPAAERPNFAPWVPAPKG